MTWIGRTTLTAFGLAAALCTTPRAQGQASGSVQGGGSADIELGATQASEIERSAGAAGNRDARGRNAQGPRARGAAPTHERSNSLRLALQGRLDSINMLRSAEPDLVGGGLGSRLLVPVITPGVRLLDDEALFVGLGFGFAGYDTDDGPGDERSRSGFSVSPLVSYDVVADDAAALSLLGWFNLGNLGETEVCAGNACMDNNDDAFGWGLSLGAGLRGFITRGLALGGEFGWGFLSVAADPDDDTFVHGVFGNLFLEASIAL